MEPDNEDMTMIEHLEELRRVLIISIIATLIMAIACWAFNQQILQILLEPVTGTGHKIVYIGVMEALMTRIKVSFFLGFLTALPVTLWQFWKFIMPALRKLERVYFTIFVIISYLLFIAGVLFGFFGVFWLGVKFLMRFGGSELTPMLTISNYISFTIMFLLPFGIIFEMPLAVYFLSKLGVLTYHAMVKKRKMAILLSVVLSAVLIPSPDIITPLLLATPIYLLYEISATIVYFVEWSKRRKAKKEAAVERESHSTAGS